MVAVPTTTLYATLALCLRWAQAHPVGEAGSGEDYEYPQPTVGDIANAWTDTSCPISHPNYCDTMGDVTEHDQGWFHGPCCDKNVDCTCSDHCSAADVPCTNGAARLPQPPVPIGEPDASCTVGAGSVGGSAYGLNWGGCFVRTTATPPTQCTD